MASQSWLRQAKSAVSTTVAAVRSTMNAAPKSKASNVGILAFEVAGLMSKLLHLWRSLSDAQLVRLHRETITLPGVRKVVSDDDAFLLRLASAELVDSLRLVAQSAAVLSLRCCDPVIREFGRRFEEFADSGRDDSRWIMGWKEMEGKVVRKMDRFVASTAALYKEMDELGDVEHSLRKIAHATGLDCGRSISTGSIAMMSEIQRKVFWKKQHIKILKQTSLWNCSFDDAVLLLARSASTVLARIKHVLGNGGQSSSPSYRSPSMCTAVYPSSSPPPDFSSGLLLPAPKQGGGGGFLENSLTALTPPPSTLGAAALALHYANLILVLERMIRSPRAVGTEARDDLYGMLPASLRGRLRARLRGMGWGTTRDAGLAAKWKAAVARIAGWLGPVAHDTIRWQGERSFERRRAAAPRGNVLLLQTLYFAEREKVEAAVTELLVGLNYVWRFDREMSALAIAAVDAGLHQQQEDDDELEDEVAAK